MLQVAGGKMDGKTFVFEEHDTFLFGRSSDCHARLPDDPYVSRHHFIMETNPPDARIRDLGSRNGTHVNGNQYGGRKKEETPEEGAKHRHPQVDLWDGDKIKVGETVFTVRVEAPAACCECGAAIAHKDRPACSWVGGTFICAPCRKKASAQTQPVKAPEPVRCQRCGKEASEELKKNHGRDYLCKACRDQAETDPGDLPWKILLDEVKAGADAERTKIEHFEVEKLLGKGACGAVYLARHKKTRERVALKVMLSQVAVSEESRKRFLQEIAVLKELNHRNIVSLRDYGSASTAFFFTMDFCEGGSISDLAKQRGNKLPLAEAFPLMLEVLEGLSHAHGKAFVHRDLKPPNILLAGAEGQRTAKVSDFGLAKCFEKAGLSGMTMTGDISGTPPFMPREQVLNFKYVTPPSDIWSIGATFYHILTGRFPRDFAKGKDPIDVILNSGVIPIRKRDPQIPAKVAEVIDRALSDEPSDRYPTAAEMRAALEKAG